MPRLPEAPLGVTPETTWSRHRRYLLSAGAGSLIVLALVDAIGIYQASLDGWNLQAPTQIVQLGDCYPGPISPQGNCAPGAGPAAIVRQCPGNPYGFEVPAPPPQPPEGCLDKVALTSTVAPDDLFPGAVLNPGDTHYPTAVSVNLFERQASGAFSGIFFLVSQS
jgi:hypothetical protein